MSTPLYHRCATSGALHPPSHPAAGEDWSRRPDLNWRPTVYKAKPTLALRRAIARLRQHNAQPNTRSYAVVCSDTPGIAPAVAPRQEVQR